MQESPEAFEKRLELLGLASERILLKTKPAAIHWHIQKPGKPGTLEATWEHGTISLPVRKNRQGDWTAEALRVLTTFS